MQVRENYHGILDSKSQGVSLKIEWAEILPELEENDLTEILDVEVEAGIKGLRILRIGKESPLCCLETLGDLGMQGLLESGDRIVAIDGIFAQKVSDLERLMVNSRLCEITIFDHRTRLTVSWMMRVKGFRRVA